MLEGTVRYPLLHTDRWHSDVMRPYTCVVIFGYENSVIEIPTEHEHTWNPHMAGRIWMIFPEAQGSWQSFFSFAGRLRVAM